ncbi:heat shock protein HSP28 [Besnoitia besnoiti]|uniref:Heat shock protein HSP28 n=1 Tax=Besnoitia besnoiti TaxID=94643 RepID=A0A2A9M9M8_BESBE|nr:heat shock protein HSP28 [Besnoitia besnoiti]PFH34705.1 heat shock protein HSP28 [Besnoitia besnoiti]
MSSSSDASANSSTAQESQMQGHEGADQTMSGAENTGCQNPLLMPTMMPQLSTMDRIYAEMMEDMSRIHHEMDRFYNQHFGSFAPLTQGNYPPHQQQPTYVSRPWWRPSSWFQPRTAPYLPMALEGGGAESSAPVAAGEGQMVPMTGGKDLSAGGPWGLMPFGWGTRCAPWASSMPKVDMRDTGAEFVVQADVPGMDRENLRVDVHDGVLRISGDQREEHKKQDEGFYLQERRQASFSRTFILPEKVKEDEIKASLVNGVLQVHVPKEVPTKPPAIRNINIE